MFFNMDEIDRKILRVLQEDDKVPYHKMGDGLGIGASTVHSRVRKMVNEGVIEGFSAIINPEKVGYEVTAWIGLSVDPKKIDSIAKNLAADDEIQIVATSTGDHDIVIQVMAETEKALWRYINQKIKAMDGVGKDLHVSSFIDVYKKTHTIRL